MSPVPEIISVEPPALTSDFLHFNFFIYILVPDMSLLCILFPMSEQGYHELPEII